METQQQCAVASAVRDGSQGAAEAGRRHLTLPGGNGGWGEARVQ